MNVQHAIRVEDITPFRYDDCNGTIFDILSGFFTDEELAGVSPQYKERFHYIFFKEGSPRIARAAHVLNKRFKEIFPITKEPFKVAYVTFVKFSDLVAVHFNKPLRINLDFNVEDFVEYLRDRKTRHHQREKYTDLNTPINENERSRATFIAESLSLDKNKVEVYVNGQLSSDFTCFVEEKADAYILHIYYNKEKDSIETISVSKSEPIKPIYKSTGASSTLTVGGKNLAITFRGFDEWKLKRKNETYKTTNTRPSVIYTSQPTERREHAVTKMSEVSVSDESIAVTIAEPEEQQQVKNHKDDKKRNFILVTNLDGTGRNLLICDTTLDECDIWLLLVDDGRKFDKVKVIDMEPWPLPENTSLMYFSPRMEYEIRRNFALQSPSLAPFFPPWEELHPKKRTPRQH